MSHLRRLKQKMALGEGSGVIRSSHKLMKLMSRDHQDILQNIEFILVSGYREDQSIDDRIVAEALKAAIAGASPQDTLAQSLKRKLEAMREFRSDVTDDVWLNGLRVVLQSVHRHSSLSPGDRGYLDFVSQFIF